MPGVMFAILNKTAVPVLRVCVQFVTYDILKRSQKRVPHPYSLVMLVDMKYALYWWQPWWFY